MTHNLGPGVKGTETMKRCILKQEIVVIRLNTPHWGTIFASKYGNWSDDCYLLTTVGLCWPHLPVAPLTTRRSRSDIYVKMRQNSESEAAYPRLWVTLGGWKLIPLNSWSRVSCNSRPTTHSLATIHERDQPTTSQHHDTVYRTMCLSLQWVRRVKCDVWTLVQTTIYHVLAVVVVIV